MKKFLYRIVQRTCGRDSDGNDTIEDKKGNNTVIFNGKEVGVLIRQQDGTYKSADGKISGTLGTDLVLTDADTGATLTLNQNFQEGDFGIHFKNTPVDPVTTLTLSGNILPTDTRPGEAGIQAAIDQYGNALGTAQPNADLLLGSDGNDHLLPGELNDEVFAGSGDDWVEGGTGNDYVDGSDGSDLLEGNAGSDILIGNIGDDRLYGNSKISTATAIANGNTDSATGQKGDWLTGNEGADTLIAGADNDVLAGGAGQDLLIAGAGDDTILGDADYTPQYIPETTPRYSMGAIDWYHTSSAPFNWTVTDASGNTVFALVQGETNPAGGGADVIYAGAGNDRVWAGAGNDIVFGEDDDDILSGEAGNDSLTARGGSNYLNVGALPRYTKPEAVNDSMLLAA